LKHEILVAWDSTQNMVSWIEKTSATKHKTLVLRNSTHKHTKTMTKYKTTSEKHKEDDIIMN